MQRHFGPQHLEVNAKRYSLRILSFDAIGPGHPCTGQGSSRVSCVSILCPFLAPSGLESNSVGIGQQVSHTRLLVR